MRRKPLGKWSEAMKNPKIILALFLLMLSGCKDPFTEIKNFLKPVNRKPLPAEVNQEINSVSDPASSSKPTAGELAKENTELLAEMFKVVFNEDEIEDKEQFGSLVLTLNQGASLEGIYRGLVMGSRYRALESKAQAAPPMELKAFAIEMSEIQDTMKNPSEFSADDAKKAPYIQYPDGDLPVPSAHEGSQEVTKKRDKAEVREELLRTFIGASTYTLKRTLGDEALKKLDEMKDDRGALAQWYAKLVIRLSASKVDFGLALRNQPDFDFHFRFAQRMALDRVKWEVLNRYHRYLNFTSK
jgi:hypothetical protein